MSDHTHHLSRHAVGRYLIALGAVAAAFALRVLLTPLTGTGAPFVLFFAAVLVTSLYVGTGPGLVALATSVPIAAYIFVVRAGYSVHEAAFQGFLYAIDEAPVGMALVALDGTFARVNRVLCEITGYPAEQLTRLKCQDITHAEDLDSDIALSEQLARGEIPRYQLEKRHIRKDGSLIDIMLSGSILRGPDNVPRYYIAQIEDISVRKRAERALRRSEAKFSGIVSIAADAIISVDTNQRIIVFNEGAEQICGYSTQEMIGTGLDRRLPERYRTTHGTSFAAFAAAETTARPMAERMEVCGVRKSGEEFPADRFWQATTRARRLGAGLGLPITKGIVEAHGGRIGWRAKSGAEHVLLHDPSVAAQCR